MSDCNKCLIAYSTGIIINQLIASTGLSGLVRAAIHMNLCAVLGVLCCVVVCSVGEQFPTTRLQSAITSRELETVCAAAIGN